jgi:antitoxin component of RelBE/YafQ-DinJ toxin-antitoxin module
MPGKGTTNRNVRIDDELWAAVQQKAVSEGTTVSEVMRKLLTKWIGEGKEASD